ncbi:MAG: hypothetical protein HQL12_06405 [Candidatus Omnitrophica bacterium]|nr:hypothetical protein [Candidatus Omnitrophota bacterium]
MASKNPHLQVAWTMGMLAGRAWRGITGLKNITLKTGSKSKTRFLPKEDIDKIVSQQVSPFNPEQHELTLQEYDRRLKAMSEAIRALQEKIVELQLSGNLNARTMAQAIGSVESSENFSVDERNILATILKQNIVLQKPELVKNKSEDGELITVS